MKRGTEERTDLWTRQQTAGASAGLDEVGEGRGRCAKSRKVSLDFDFKDVK